MAAQPIKPNPSSGRFVKGVSGNPSGRPKGSTNHDAELRRLEEAAMLLADNVADAIAEAAKAAFVEIGVQQLMPLIEAITDNAKEAVLNGEIGPSSVASLRHWYEDHRGDADNPSGGAFFAHIGLPEDGSWDAFRSHYTSRRRIDHNRHCSDLLSYPPIAQAINDRTEKAA